MAIGLVPAWSNSRLKDYEKCPKILWYKVVERIKEPENIHMERGTKIHAAMEAKIKGDDTLLNEVIANDKKYNFKFDDFLEGLQKLYPETVSLELEIAFDEYWQPAKWTAPDVWTRMKLDVLKIEGDKATVYDWKTGKWDGNQIAHMDQGKQYAIGVLMSSSTINTVTSQMVYLDHNRFGPALQTHRKDLEKLKNQLEKRAFTLTEDRELLARPSRSACKWCYYGKEKICSERWED